MEKGIIEMNPFLPFTPVSGPNFIDRNEVLSTVFGRVQRLAPSHTAIIGNPHVGKTSLLLQMARPEVFSQQVSQPERYAIVEIDFQLFGESKTPNDFWRELIMQAVASQSSVTDELIPLSKKKKIDEQMLYKSFQKVAASNGRIVAFIDEFDYLFNLPKFCTLDFLSVLRTIAMKSGGLVLVTASRMSVAQMNEEGRSLKATRGSDLFNYLEDQSLGGFTDDDARIWLKEILSIEAVEEVLLLAGRHPLLVQLAGQLFYDAIYDRKMQPKDYVSLRDPFFNKADQQFQDVWNYLSSEAQLALVIFALNDLQGKIDGYTFNLDGAEQTLHWYQNQVKDMIRRGTLEMRNDQHSFGSLAFRSWILEQKVIGTRGDESQEAFQKWLHNKQFKLGGLITNEEIAWLQKAWKAIPSDLIEIAKKIILPKELQ